MTTVKAVCDDAGGNGDNLIPYYSIRSPITLFLRLYTCPNNHLDRFEIIVSEVIIYKN